MHAGEQACAGSSGDPSPIRSGLTLPTLLQLLAGCWVQAGPWVSESCLMIFTLIGQ